MVAIPRGEGLGIAGGYADMVEREGALLDVGRCVGRSIVDRRSRTERDAGLFRPDVDRAALFRHWPRRADLPTEQLAQCFGGSVGIGDGDAQAIAICNAHVGLSFGWNGREAVIHNSSS